MSAVGRLRNIQMLVIGASAGGVDALMSILPNLRSPSGISAAVVLHTPSDGQNLLPALLSPDCSFKVKEAESGEPICPETIYIAPSNYHLCLEPNHTLSLSSEELVNFSRPAIDILFESAAFAYQKKVLGILLTGSNEDGAQGMKTIQDQGGLTIVQNPDGLDYPTMPKSALKIMKPDFIMTLKEINSFLSDFTKGKKYGN